MTSPQTRLNPKELRALFKVRGDAMFASVAPYYGFRDEEAFDNLWQYAFNLSCREQEGEPDDSAPTRSELSARRAEGHRLATLMRDHAASMLASLQAIHDAKLRFNDDVVRWHPPLLEAVFDMDLGGPDDICLPNALAPLQSFFADVDWDAAESKLAAMAALPVKARLDRGPVANMTLRRAIAACRTYWRDVEGRAWSMSMLKHPTTRYENNTDNLKGECEIFVALLLSVCGLRFDLQDLSSAWVAVDAEAKESR